MLKQFPYLVFLIEAGYLHGKYDKWPDGWSHEEDTKYGINLYSTENLAYMQSNEMFDLTNFAFIKLRCIGWSDTGSAGKITLKALNSAGNVERSIYQDFNWYDSREDANISLDLDVSSLLGKHYIRIELQRTNSTYGVSIKAPVTLTAI